MPAIPYLKKKFGQTYLVWLENSNSYLQLENPAWFIFRKLAHQTSKDLIARDFANRYGISFEDSQAVVIEICSEIEKTNQAEITSSREVDATEELKGKSFTPYAFHYYRFGNQLISFSFETEVLENYLHPLVSHLEVFYPGSEGILFELYNYEGTIVFRFEGIVEGVWCQNETHLVKGKIYSFLINVMYNKTDADWLMTVHASAITNSKKTILFSAPAGHGKTTIAALLQSQGYTLISDDFVPIESRSFCAYPFPIATSIKEGSMDLLAFRFPSLEQKTLNYISPEKSVRYIPLTSCSDLENEICPVREFIFIKFDSCVDFQMEKIEPLQAFKLLLNEAWISSKRSNVELLFDHLFNFSFYKLTYSNNIKALGAITNLFCDDK